MSSMSSFNVGGGHSKSKPTIPKGKTRQNLATIIHGKIAILSSNRSLSHEQVVDAAVREVACTCPHDVDVLRRVHDDPNLHPSNNFGSMSISLASTSYCNRHRQCVYFVLGCAVLTAIE